MDAKELTEKLKEKGVEARVGGGEKRFRISFKKRTITLKKSGEVDLDKLAAYLKK